MKSGAIALCSMISLAMSLVGTSFVFFVRWAWPVHPDDTFAILLTGGLAAMVGAIAVVAAGPIRR